SQVVLTSYTVSPNSAHPGDSVTVSAVLTNTGNETASQVLVQLDTSSPVLIAGSKGSSFAVGDMAARASKTITMALVGAHQAPPRSPGAAVHNHFLAGQRRQTHHRQHLAQRRSAGRASLTGRAGQLYSVAYLRAARSAGHGASRHLQQGQ